MKKEFYLCQRGKKVVVSFGDGTKSVAKSVIDRAKSQYLQKQYNYFVLYQFDYETNSLYELRKIFIN